MVTYPDADILDVVGLSSCPVPPENFIRQFLLKKLGPIPLFFRTNFRTGTKPLPCGSISRGIGEFL